jgi:hypothetical protein
MLARIVGAASWVAVGAIAGTVIASAVVAGPVDESALREYARQKRADRVEMETRRLERLHPEEGAGRSVDGAAQRSRRGAAVGALRVRRSRQAAQGPIPT